MPTYEYKCEACGNEFEQFQSITAPPTKKCPKCGKNKVKRLISTGAGLIFKGSGFYITDYRSEAYKGDAAKNESAAKGEAKADGAKTETGKSEGGKSETTSATESKPAAQTESAPPKSEAPSKTARPAKNAKPK